MDNRKDRRYFSWKHTGIWTSFPQQFPSEPSTDSHPEQSSRHSQPHKISRASGSDFLRKGMIYFLARWMNRLHLGWCSERKSQTDGCDWPHAPTTGSEAVGCGPWLVPAPQLGFFLRPEQSWWGRGRRESRERLRRFVRAWVQIEFALHSSPSLTTSRLSFSSVNFLFPTYWCQHLWAMSRAASWQVGKK